MGSRPAARQNKGNANTPFRTAHQKNPAFA